MDKLTNKQRIFAEEYLKDFNAARAARAAGYSEKYVNTNASKLLHNTTIKKYIEQVNNIATNDRILTIEQIKEFYSGIVLSEETDLSQRISAADKLSKYVGMSLVETAKREYDLKKLELEMKRLELLIEREKVADDENNTGIVMIPSLDLESYEREKEEFLRELEVN